MKFPNALFSTQIRTISGDVAKKSKNSTSKETLLQNCSLVWLDDEIDETDQDYSLTLSQLGEIINDIHIFKSIDACIDYVTDMDEQQIFMVISVELARKWIRDMHGIGNLVRMYVVSRKPTLDQHQTWIKPWQKVRDACSDVQFIFQDLQMAMKELNHDLIPISRVNTGNNRKKIDCSTLDPSFLHTQLIKSTLLMMRHDDRSPQDLINYCREQSFLNSYQAELLDEFERSYTSNKAIWWYTRECFIYQMLNLALRSMQVDMIVRMRFFICDLHRQIQQIHKRQSSQYANTSFTVYRGQRMDLKEWNKLTSSVGGFLSWNSFFSASRTRDSPLLVAQSAVDTSHMVGILFIVKVDTSMKSTVFADIRELSYFNNEDEILFTMNSVFRVKTITQTSGQDRLFQMELDLSNDDDKQLQTVTNTIEREITGLTCIRRMADLFIHLKQPNALEKLYGNILKQSSDEDEEAIECNYYLALVKNFQGNRKKATEHLRKALSLAQKYLTQDNPKLKAVYNTIAATYGRMGEYSSALFFYEKAIDLQRKMIPEDHSALASIYNRIALAYETIGRDSKALLFYEKAFEIQKQKLPYNHPYIAVCSANIGFMYENMRKQTKALAFNDKVLAIQMSTPRSRYSQFANYFDNMGAVYQHIGRYKKAYVFYEKALEIQRKNFVDNRSHLINLYNAIGLTCDHLAEYSKALNYYENALDIQQETLRSNHPQLAPTYYNMACVYYKTGEYSMALSIYQRVLDIEQKNNPHDYIRFALLYSYIALIYCLMNEVSMAMKFSEQALFMEERNTVSHHPFCATIYRNMGLMYKHMNSYSQALMFCEKALQIQQISLHLNHPDLAGSYIIIGILQYNIGRLSEALKFVQRSLEINQLCLPSTHPEIRIALQWIGTIRKEMADTS